MIDLDKKYLNILKTTISKYLKDCKIYLYGSRVKGTARKYSDIDIALSCRDLNKNTLLKIKIEFENSTLPYDVDVIDLNNISETFKNRIKPYLVEI